MGLEGMAKAHLAEEAKWSVTWVMERRLEGRKMISRWNN